MQLRRRRAGNGFDCPPEEDVGDALDEAWVDITGRGHDPDKVKAARQSDTPHCREITTYVEVPIEELACYMQRTYTGTMA